MKLVNSGKLFTSACVLSLALGIGGTAHATHKGTEHGNGNNNKDPKLTVEVEAFCGDPMAVEYDIYGNVLNTFAENVAVRLTNDGDVGSSGAEVSQLTIVCTAAVKAGRGKPNDVTFTTITIDYPGFGVVDATCPLGSIPEGGTEWKVTATASGEDVGRDVSDRCEEVPAP